MGIVPGVVHSGQDCKTSPTGHGLDGWDSHYKEKVNQ